SHLNRTRSNAPIPALTPMLLEMLLQPDAGFFGEGSGFGNVFADIMIIVWRNGYRSLKGIERHPEGADGPLINRQQVSLPFAHVDCRSFRADQVQKQSKRHREQ